MNIVSWLLVLLLSCSSAAPAFAAAADKSIAGISFSAPEDWKETKPSSAMRAFQFEIPSEAGESAELAVFYFGQSMGGDIQMNIQRWKSQFASLAEEKSEKKVSHGIPVTEVYLRGKYQQTAGPMMAPQGEPKDNYAVLGAIVEAPQGLVFLKMTGPEAAIAAARPGFEQLVGSIQ